MLGPIHFAFAFAALISGAVVTCRTKGGQQHRVWGYVYSMSLLLVNLSALTIYQESVGAGPFHILALISLATLISGFIPAFLRRPHDSWLDLHAYFMSWSYVGLIAAGVAQTVTLAANQPPWLTVGIPSVLVVAIGGVLIHTRVRRTLIGFASGNRPEHTGRG